MEGSKEQHLSEIEIFWNI